MRFNIDASQFCYHFFGTKAQNAHAWIQH
jgi:hypothetical protein